MSRVLIVDDDEADLLLGKSILQKGGHQVYFAGDGGAALKLYMSNTIDVVVTDLNMPMPDGVELIAALMRMDPDVVIVAVSGAGASKLGLARVGGAKATLPKPVDAQRLLDAVAAAAAAA